MRIHTTRVQCYQYQLFQWLFLLNSKQHVENFDQADECRSPTTKHWSINHRLYHGSELYGKQYCAPGNQ